MVTNKIGQNAKEKGVMEAPKREGKKKKIGMYTNIYQNYCCRKVFQHPGAQMCFYCHDCQSNASSGTLKICHVFAFWMHTGQGSSV